MPSASLLPDYFETFQKLTDDHRSTHKDFRNLFAYYKEQHGVLQSLYALPDKFEVMDKRERKQLRAEQAKLMEEVRAMQETMDMNTSEGYADEDKTTTTTDGTDIHVPSRTSDVHDSSSSSQSSVTSTSSRSRQRAQHTERRPVRTPSSSTFASAAATPALHRRTKLQRAPLSRTHELAPVPPPPSHLDTTRAKRLRMVRGTSQSAVGGSELTRAINRSGSGGKYWTWRRRRLMGRKNR